MKSIYEEYLKWKDDEEIGEYIISSKALRRAADVLELETDSSGNQELLVEKVKLGKDDDNTIETIGISIRNKHSKQGIYLADRDYQFDWNTLDTMIDSSLDKEKVKRIKEIDEIIEDLVDEKNKLVKELRE